MTNTNGLEVAGLTTLTDVEMKEANGGFIWMIPIAIGAVAIAGGIALLWNYVNTKLKKAWG